MIQKYARVGLFLLLFPLLQPSPGIAADTITVNFDDLDPWWSNDYPIYEGYAGLNWNNFTSMYVTSQFSAQYLSGYLTGMVSPYFVAYNKDGNPAEFWSNTPFKLVSVYLTAGWRSDLQVTVEGFLGQNLLYSQTVKLSALEPTLFTFNYNGVDRVRFTSSGGTPQWPEMGDGIQFVMDDLTLGASDTAEDPPITVDIKPGSTDNSINQRSYGVIPIAILSADGFSAPEMVDVNPSTLTFGRTGSEQSLAACHTEDLNNDGLLDLICHFFTQKTGFVCGDETGTLQGVTKGGAPIIGQEPVKIVPCRR